MLQDVQLPRWLEWVHHSLPPELGVGVLLVSAPLAVGVIAAVVTLVVLYLSDRMGLARLVWHPPLFTFAFFVLVYGLLGLWLLPR